MKLSNVAGALAFPGGIAWNVESSDRCWFLRPGRAAAGSRTGPRQSSRVRPLYRRCCTDTLMLLFRAASTSSVWSQPQYACWGLTNTGRVSGCPSRTSSCFSGLAEATHPLRRLGSRALVLGASGITPEGRASILQKRVCLLLGLVIRRKSWQARPKRKRQRDVSW